MKNGEIKMNDQKYQPPQQYQPPAQPYQQPAKMNLYDHFVGPGKLGLFLLLSAGLLALGVLILDLTFSGMLSDGIDVLLFLGTLMIDLGIISILTLLLIGGITRNDLAEKAQATLLRAAGFGLGIYILTWALRILYGSSLLSLMNFNPYF